MLTAMYNAVMRWSAHPRAEAALAVVSFTESSFFPIPPDAMLIPMVLARPERAWRIATICTIASVLGGILGYVIGMFLYQALAEPIVQLYHLEAGFEKFRQGFDEYGVWIILIKGLTPIPYKLVTIASGVFNFNFAVFLIASIATRGARFFLVAALLRRYGPPIREFIEKYLTLVTTVAVLLIVGGVYAVTQLR